MAATCTVALILTSLTAAADAMTPKVSHWSCCNDIGGDAANADCGARGFGFRWVPGQVVDGGRAGEVDEARALSLLYVASICTLICGWAMITQVEWTAGHRREVAVAVLFYAFGAVGFAAAQYTGESVLFMEPLNLMRVTNVFALYLVALVFLNAKEEAIVGKDVASIEDSDIKWLEFAKFSMFSAITYAQEKHLWQPLFGISLPIVAVLVIYILFNRRNHHIVVMSTLVALFSVITVFPPFTVLEDSTSRNSIVSSPSFRLFWSTNWSFAVIPVCTSILMLRRSHSLLLSSIVAFFSVGLISILAILGPPMFDGADFLYQRAHNNGRWCCMEPSKHSSSSCKGTMRFHRSSRAPEAWSSEVWAMIFITVLTNASGIPATLYVWKIGSPYTAVVGLSTIVYSTLYHLADTIDDTFTGINEGNWHRLDNIFAILSFVNAQLYITEATLSHEKRKALRTTVILFTVLLQEIGPWKLECTLIPIFLGSMFLAHYLYHHPLVRIELKAEIKRNQDFFTAGGLLFLGVMGFIRGLDQNKDFLRIGHGCWHLFTGFSFFYLSRGLFQVVRTFQTKSD